MKKPEVRAAIVECLGAVLAPAGFKVRSGLAGIKSEKSLARTIPGGLQDIGFSLVDYRPLFTFSIIVTVRIDEIEKLLELIHETPAKYVGMGSTIVQPLAYFGNIPEHIEVRTVADILSAVTRLSPILQDEVVPFLDRYHDIQSLDQGVNWDGNIRRFGDGWETRAIVLARLAGNPRYLEVVEQYREKLRSKVDHIRDRYEKVAVHLEALLLN